MRGHLLRSGLARGVIELRQTLTNGTDLFGYVLTPVLLIGLLFLIRDKTVPGSEISLGAYSLVSSLAMLLVLGALTSTAQYLTMDREDGTLLRAKATPNGMVGYLIGKIVLIVGATAVSCVAALVPGWFVVDGLRLDVTGALTLLWLAPLALLAIMPTGAMLGAFFNNARTAAVLMLPVTGLTAISGIFYPLAMLPGWLQGVAQAFPMYWLGLGLRSSFLPDSLAAAEVSGSWRLLEAAGVLILWSVVGLALAPGVLRRMASRESGSAVAARRERAMSRAV
ncbi:ABC transporter permease [Actinoplanes sp. NBRC 101535]|uniref:ABC transporter permease n=1 Tax=Actinoplanes sp. NBRC 101535 TaxID=3032196 RepID=UPI0024A44266|nr:ABC transporter permease [Actinoplanes sp. NBRC 101535]GLY03699.1 transport permease protein [Actinoplanes sp. NBRC 101535]